jgi:hypothetical protein
VRNLSRFRPSPAMGVALIALFLSIGGIGYAAATIGSNDIKKNAVKSRHIKNGQVKKKDIHGGAVASGAVLDNSLTGADIDESTLGEVPSAGNAERLGGEGPGSYQSRIMWARIADNGAILAQSGGISLTAHPSAGRYFIDFGTRVQGNGLFATTTGAQVGESSAKASPCGGAAAGPDALPCVVGANDANHARVETFGDTTQGDRDFYIELIK